jgi:hypothetical protein
VVLDRPNAGIEISNFVRCVNVCPRILCCLVIRQSFMQITLQIYNIHTFRINLQPEHLYFPLCFISELFTGFDLLLFLKPESRDTAVGIVTGYWLDDRGFGVRVPVGSRIFTSPRSPDRLRGPPNLLSNGYQRLRLRG